MTEILPPMAKPLRHVVRSCCVVYNMNSKYNQSRLIIFKMHPYNCLGNSVVFHMPLVELPRILFFKMQT
jgi:hypothetical protein